MRLSLKYARSPSLGSSENAALWTVLRSLSADLFVATAFHLKPCHRCALVLITWSPEGHMDIRTVFQLFLTNDLVVTQRPASY